MLVLSRQRDESIIIGDDIEITVVDIRGDKVRLGVTAPKEIAVHRKEVWDAIRQEARERKIPVQQLVEEHLAAKAQEHEDQAKKLRELAARGQA